MINLDKIIEQAIKKDASDIHLMLDNKPIFRIGDALVKMEGSVPLENNDMYKIYNYFTQGNTAKEKYFKEHKKVDILYEYNDINLGVNVSYSNNVPAYRMKILRNQLPEYEELGIPDSIRKMTAQKQGLILVTGTRKSGKTTTLNALIRHINETQNKKIITLERTREYIHKSRNSIILQKEVGEGKDFVTFYDGIKNAINEDCDVLVIEDIKNKETLEAVLDIVETGRLVIAGFHSETCVNSLEKIINFYDVKDQARIKYLLSTLLKIVISQKLIVSTKGNLELVPEVMLINKNISNNIKQENINIVDIQKEMQNSRDCVSMVESLANLYINNKITLKQAKSLLNDDDKDLLNKMIMKKRIENK